MGASFKDVPGGTAHWVFTGNSNYKDQSGDLAVVISKASTSCNVGGYNGPYDANSHGATGSCSGIGGENAGTLELGASFKDVPGGTAHWAFTGNSNYNDQRGDVAITINKAEASCTVSGYTGMYDAASHGASGSCSGIGGESAGSLDLGASFKDVPGGTAHWAFTGNSNYNDQRGDVAITINKAEASCTVSGYTGMYDATSHGATGSCSGIGGELAGTLDLGASYKNVPGGTAHWLFTGNGNYNNQAGDVVINIRKANASCMVNGYIGVYDAAFHGASGSCSGVGGESAGSLVLGATYKAVPGGTAHWVFTANGNYNDQSADVAIIINKAEATCTVSGYTGTYDGAGHGATGSCYGIGGENAGTLDLGASFKDVPGGTAHWAFTGNGNYNNQVGNAPVVINRKAASVTPDSFSRQYSDPNPILTGTLSGFLEMVTAVYSTDATPGSAPGLYQIQATLRSASTLDNYTIACNLGTLTVTLEDARVTYTGPVFVTTASETATAVPVPLSATIQDITAVGGDPNAGDIRNAWVTFLVNGAPVGCSKLPVSLVNATDTTIGTAGCNWTGNIDNHTITVVVGGYYEADASSDFEISLEVAPGGGTNFITGGGYLAVTGSAGRYPGSSGTKMNFGFTVKYNKAKTNLQGHANIIYRNGGRVYQIKSNSITSLTVNAGPNGKPPSAASFISKANLADITNPLSPINLGGGYTLQMAMLDNGEPGSADTIGLMLTDGGALLFSSNWSGVQTTQKMLIGGNVVVH